MTCGWMDHSYQLTGYNPYDDRDMYECMHCGKVKSEKAKPVYTHDVTTACCASEWIGNQPTPFFAVGDDFDCPQHGPTRVVTIQSRLTRGTPEPTASTDQDESSGLGCLLVMAVVLILLLVGCTALGNELFTP